jgi:hypothetical protein
MITSTFRRDLRVVVVYMGVWWHSGSSPVAPPVGADVPALGPVPGPGFGPSVEPDEPSFSEGGGASIGVVEL